MAATVQVESRINAPADRVFALLTNLADLPRLIPDIKKVEVLTPGPVGVGTRFKETRVMFGKEATETMEFAAFDPPDGYTLVANSCGCRYEITHECRPEAGGTAAAVNFRMTP